MTFAQFYADVSAAVFPEGEAENLVSLHKLWLKDALIDLQTKIPCLRTDHAEYIGQDATEYFCGASRFDGVDGSIERIYTLGTSGGCDLVEYKYVDPQQMLAMISKYRCCKPSDSHGMNPYMQPPGEPEYPLGDSEMNKGYRTPQGDGFWSLHRGHLYVFPAIEDTEQIVVEWNGVRRTFCDSTTIPSTFLQRDVVNAVEAYVQMEVERRETKDMSSWKLQSEYYREALSQLIWECNRKIRPVRQTKSLVPDAC